MDIYENTSGNIVMDLNTQLRYDEVDAYLEEIRKEVERLKQLNKERFLIGGPEDNNTWTVSRKGYKVMFRIPSPFLRDNVVTFEVGSEVGNALKQALA